MTPLMELGSFDSSDVCMKNNYEWHVCCNETIPKKKCKCSLLWQSNKTNYSLKGSLNGWTIKQTKGAIFQCLHSLNWAIAFKLCHNGCEY